MAKGDMSFIAAIASLIDRCFHKDVTRPYFEITQYLSQQFTVLAAPG